MASTHGRMRSSSNFGNRPAPSVEAMSRMAPHFSATVIGTHSSGGAGVLSPSKDCRSARSVNAAVSTMPIPAAATNMGYARHTPMRIVISAANPLKPGDEQDFRLIFESIPTNWNTQMPEIHIVRVVTK